MVKYTLATCPVFRDHLNVRKKIALHVATSNCEYFEIADDFKFLTRDSNATDSLKMGLRHNIFHVGKNIEQLLSYDDRHKVFSRLYRYVTASIDDFLSMSNCNWDAIEQHRQKRKRVLCV